MTDNDSSKSGFAGAARTEEQKREDAQNALYEAIRPILKFLNEIGNASSGLVRSERGYAYGLFTELLEHPQREYLTIPLALYINSSNKMSFECMMPLETPEESYMRVFIFDSLHRHPEGGWTPSYTGSINADVVRQKLKRVLGACDFLDEEDRSAVQKLLANPIAQSSSQPKTEPT